MPLSFPTLLVTATALPFPLLLAAAEADGKGTSVIVSVMVAFFAAIPPTLMAWGAMKQSRSNAAKTDAVEKKTDVVIGKAEEIHTLTNSNLTRVMADLAIANKRIIGLETALASITPVIEKIPLLLPKSSVKSKVNKEVVLTKVKAATDNAVAAGAAATATAQKETAVVVKKAASDAKTAKAAHDKLAKKNPPAAA